VYPLPRAPYLLMLCHRRQVYPCVVQDVMRGIVSLVGGCRIVEVVGYSEGLEKGFVNAIEICS
jgi:hypothetical protein